MSKKLLKVIPLIQSKAIIDDSVQWNKKKKKRTTDFIDKGVKDIIGISLVSETADLIESL